MMVGLSFQQVWNEGSGRMFYVIFPLTNFPLHFPDSPDTHYVMPHHVRPSNSPQCGRNNFKKTRGLGVCVEHALEPQVHSSWVHSLYVQGCQHLRLWEWSLHRAVHPVVK